MFPSGGAYDILRKCVDCIIKPKLTFSLKKVYGMFMVDSDKRRNGEFFLYDAIIYFDFYALYSLCARVFYEALKIYC